MLYYRINFNHPFEGQPDAEEKVHRAAARVIATAAEMGVEAKDVSVGENLTLMHDGKIKNMGEFIAMVYEHVDAITNEVIH